MEAEGGQDVLFDIDWRHATVGGASARGPCQCFYTATINVRTRKAVTGQGAGFNRGRGDRMRRAPDEMSHYPEYDYIIVNREVEESIEMAMAILKAERLKRARQTGLGNSSKAFAKAAEHHGKRRECGNIQLLGLFAHLYLQTRAAPQQGRRGKQAALKRFSSLPKCRCRNGFYITGVAVELRLIKRVQPHNRKITAAVA